MNTTSESRSSVAAFAYEDVSWRLIRVVLKRRVARLRHRESFDRVRVHTDTICCECSEEGVIVHATLHAESHVSAMGAILDLKVSIAAARGCGDLQFRRGAHLVDTDKTRGGDSEKFTRAIIESEAISTFEGSQSPWCP